MAMGEGSRPAPGPPDGDAAACDPDDAPTVRPPPAMPSGAIAGARSDAPPAAPAGTGPVTDPDILRRAVLRNLGRRVRGSGKLVFPCVPALADEIVRALAAAFDALGKPFSDAEIAELRHNVDDQLHAGFQQSPYSDLVVTFETRTPAREGIGYHVKYAVSTIEAQYEIWVATRKPPLFGTHPDAKVMDLAGSLGEPADAPVLDVGAGTGRNTLPLARRGHPTWAVEVVPALSDILRKAAEEAGVHVDIVVGDVLDDDLGLPRKRFGLVVLAEVIASHFRDVMQLRALLERMAPALRPGGILLFSIFLAHDGYAPEGLARQASQVCWSTLYTREDLAIATEGLPYEALSDESVYAYERERLPPEAWPPTGWFEGWTRGQDVFSIVAERSPMELRWIALRKRG